MPKPSSAIYDYISTRNYPPAKSRSESKVSRDEELRSDVIDEMNCVPMLNLDLIEVEVRNGTAILVGQVESYAMRSAAETAACRATGGKVATRLSIKRSSKALSSKPWADEVGSSLQDGRNDSRRALE